METWSLDSEKNCSPERVSFISPSFSLFAPANAGLETQKFLRTIHSWLLRSSRVVYSDFRDRIRRVGTPQRSHIDRSNGSRYRRFASVPGTIEIADCADGEFDEQLGTRKKGLEIWSGDWNLMNIVMGNWKNHVSRQGVDHSMYSRINGCGRTSIS